MNGVTGFPMRIKIRVDMAIKPTINHFSCFSIVLLNVRMKKTEV